MRILLIDDDVSVSETLGHILKRLNHDMTSVTTGEAGRRAFSQTSYDLIITDLQLPDTDGLSLVREILEKHPQAAVILITGYGTTDVAIQAMQLGAFDYFTKPFEADEIIDCVQRVGETLSNKNNPLITEAETSISASGLIGQSNSMQTLYKAIGRISNTQTDVLITGETGTGKELVAKAIQYYSQRASQPFVCVNCSALPESIIESELFGHEKGAFTGASNKYMGRFEQAHTGTLFLDEIGELNPNMQVKLLRFLQDKTIQPLGGSTSKPLDIRIIAATNRDLEKEVENGRFREDLYYRLKVAHLHLPALRDHPEDIPLLLDYFNKKYAQEFSSKEVFFSEDALLALKQASWPGNIRQLENLTKQLLVISNGRHRSKKDVEGVLCSADTHTDLRTTFSQMELPELADRFIQKALDTHQENLVKEVTEHIERALYKQIIARTQGHQSEASQRLGVSMKTLRDKLKKYGYHPKTNDTLS